MIKEIERNNFKKDFPKINFKIHKYNQSQCTDGKSNNGIGALEDLDKVEQEKVSKFYEDIGLYAKAKGSKK